MLRKVRNSSEKIIAYASKTLNNSQTKKCTTYKELLAVRRSCHFLWGRQFKVKTDHGSLIWLKSFKNQARMIVRCISVLDTSNLEIEHRRSSLHGNADGLPRNPNKRCLRSNVDSLAPSQVSDKKQERSPLSPPRKLHRPVIAQHRINVTSEYNPNMA